MRDYPDRVQMGKKRDSGVSMPPSLSNLTEFSAFKTNLSSQALDALKKSHPQYVNVFRAAIRHGKGFGSAQTLAEPHLRKGISEKWTIALNGVHAVEIGLDKTQRSLIFLRSEASIGDIGIGTSYPR